MRRLRDEIDPHIAATLLMLAPFVCLGWWWLAVPLLVPQGRICTRALVDLPLFKLRPWAYLVANEAFVCGFVVVLAGVRFAIRVAAEYPAPGT